MAKRLEYIMLNYVFISSLHFSVIANWLVVNIAAILIHDVKQAFQIKKVFIVLIFDIKKVFDRVSEVWLSEKL